MQSNFSIGHMVPDCFTREFVDQFLWWYEVITSFDFVEFSKAMNHTDYQKYEDETKHGEQQRGRGKKKKKVLLLKTASNQYQSQEPLEMSEHLQGW